MPAVPIPHPPRPDFAGASGVEDVGIKGLPDPVADADTADTGDGLQTAPETIVLAPRRRWRCCYWRRCQMAT
jgi:hypothetical protein